MTCEDNILTRLRADFPNWAIGRPSVRASPCSEHGVWRATRKELLGAEEMDGGLCHTLTADTAQELRDALAGQHRIDPKSPQDLS